MDMETFRRKNDLVKQYAADAAEGVTLFTTRIEPTDDGYNFTELTDMLAWRDSRH
jgi:hypothetical protein